MNSFVDKHINKIIRNTNLSKDEKSDLKEYLYSSFNNKYDNYIAAGLDKNAALNKALNELGTEEEFSYELNSNINTVPKLMQYLSIILISIDLFFLILRTNLCLTFSPNFCYQLANLVPFRMIIMRIVNHHIDGFIITELSIAPFFIPIGYLIPSALNKIHNIIYNVKALIFVVILFEVVELIFRFGSCHIDYAIVNFIFSLIGYFLFNITIRILNKRNFSSNLPL
ncbi:VanZ family protein [Inconstantimicrobium mannanitabidum]|uniref:Uncharacterized protein n=1 Tax=Inconstantimicrobium mannanitabidum TaxID=1604901 RepID=A0ACB5RGJ0_9CLOT|nr:VanZ family protein [Clostridium sp. TW13]GKX68169.1 hypothetical protein rsdtw13_34270 [Clostridium sp. TW13]